MSLARCSKCGGAIAAGTNCYACAIREGRAVKPPKYGGRPLKPAQRAIVSRSIGRRSGVTDRIRRLLSDGAEWTAHAVEKSLELDAALVCTVLGMLVNSGQARRVKKDSQRRKRVWHYTLTDDARRRVLERAAP